MKLSLVNAAALILRKLESNSKQVEIFCQMIEELRYSRNYQNRMTFIDLCEAVMRHYSARFFYNNFVDQIVTMHNVSGLCLTMITKMWRRTVVSQLINRLTLLCALPY